MYYLIIKVVINMGQGHHGGGGMANSFALIVVLFILLVIIGTAYVGSSY
jgi:uncharacterized protein (TIGR01732 family)